MVDIRSEWTNTYLKFRLLADYTDIIVGVAEHPQGGFLVEQGYFAKTHMFKREYNTLDADTIDTEIDVDNPYSGMQTSIFDLLNDAGRLCQ